MKKRTVLHVLNSRRFSGAENVVCQIITFCSPEEYTFVYCSPDGQIREALEERSIMFAPLSELSVPSLKGVIRTVRPDIIHAHDFTAGVMAALAAPRGMPVVSHLHNNPPWIRHAGLKTAAYTACSLRFDRIVAVSDAVFDEFIWNRVFRKRAEVIGNPVDVEQVRQKAAHNSSDDVPKSDIMFLGRLSPQKNPLGFLEIVGCVSKRKPDLRVAVVGDGELRNEVEHKIKELHLENTVTLYGFRYNPYSYLANTRLLCMPSVWEGFGLAAVEALALGKPVIAAPVGGLAGIVNETCGTLCNSVGNFVSSIIRCLTDGEYYALLSSGAFRRADELHNIGTYTERIEKMYRSL